MFEGTHLDLHLEVGLEVGQQREEDGQRQLEDLGHRGDAVLGQRHAQVLLDGVDEHLVGLEDGAGVLQDGQQQLQGQHLGAQLVGPGGGMGEGWGRDGGDGGGDGVGDEVILVITIVLDDCRARLIRSYYSCD